MGIATSGLVSGLKTDQIVAQLLALERNPITFLQQNQRKIETKQASLSSVTIKLSSLQSAAATLNSEQNFNTKSLSVTASPAGADMLTATASSTAAVGSYTLQVSQLAQAHKIGSQGFASDTTPLLNALSYPSGGDFSFKVGAAGAVTTMAISPTTTLQQLRDAINTANAGVTATLLNDGSPTNPYRLVLTSNTSGLGKDIQITTNVTKLDFSTGSVKPVVPGAPNSYAGTVTSSGTYTGPGNKSYLIHIMTGGAPGTATFKVSTDGGTTFNDNGGAGFATVDGAAVAVGTEGVNVTFNGGTLTSGDRFIIDAYNPIEQAAAATTNSSAYTGTVASSGTYTGTAGKTYLLEMITAGTVDGTARYKFSTDGGLTFNDNGGAGYTPSATATLIGNTTEGVKLAFTNSGTFAVGDRFTVDVLHPTLQKAQDAILKVDNLTLVKSSNTITDVIQGVTLNLLSAEAGTTVQLAVSTDTKPATQKIKDFVSAYNDVLKFLNEQQSFDPKVKKVSPLLGDFTITGLQHRIQSLITGAVPGISSGKVNLAQIGITSNSKTGDLKLDDTKLSSALSTDPTGVLKLFVGTGTPTDNTIIFVNKTDKTRDGTYAINLTTVPQLASFASATALQAAGLGANELLTFTYTSNATSSAPTTTAFSVNFLQNDTINTVVDKLNSTFATQGVALEASHDSGKLQLQSKDYGADIKFTVVSDRAAGTTSTGIGTVVQTRTGVDVVGSINNHPGVGKGHTLTGSSGTEEEGLVIRTTATTPGSVGTITVSLGVADRLGRELTSLLDLNTGALKGRQDGLQKNIDDLTAQIAKKEARLVTLEKRLRAEFTSLETLLAKFQAQGQFLSNQLGQLGNAGR